MQITIFWIEINGTQVRCLDIWLLGVFNLLEKNVMGLTPSSPLTVNSICHKGNTVFVMRDDAFAHKNRLEKNCYNSAIGGRWGQSALQEHGGLKGTRQLRINLKHLKTRQHQTKRVRGNSIQVKSIRMRLASGSKVPSR